MEYDEARFQKQLERTFFRIRQVFSPSLNPELPSSVSHVYADKFSLADVLGKLALASMMDTLNSLCSVAELFLRASDSAVLRLDAEERCVFVRQEILNEGGVTVRAHHHQTGLFWSRSHTHQVRFHWQLNVKYSLKLIVTNKQLREELHVFTHEGETELVTPTDTQPRSTATCIESIDLDLSWFLRTLRVGFQIERSSLLCRTPCRNPQVDEAMAFFKQAFKWSERVSAYLTNVTKINTSELEAKARTLFMPVVPFFLTSLSSPVEAPLSFVASLLDEHARVLGQIQAQLSSSSSASSASSASSSPSASSSSSASFSSSPSSSWEPFVDLTNTISLLIFHFAHISQHFCDGVNYLEALLYRQLVSVIGKEVSPSDFDLFVRYHTSRLFRPLYAPQVFCYPIRRPLRDCEGFVEICKEGTPIASYVSHFRPSSPICFNLGPGTTVCCSGEVFVHGYLQHQFEGQCSPHVLNVRAKAYGCFLVLLGVMCERGRFEPRHGMIVQNRDDISIPLDLEVLPSAGEFKRAISSLSPEQERFAKMYRAMQLSSTLFGVCIIQIKPLLERVLGLREDSLLKEISLIQQLLTLFTKYQIPSDLVRFDGAQDAETHEMVARVRASVSAVQQVVEELKQQEIADVWQPYVARKLVEENERDAERAATAKFDASIKDRSSSSDEAEAIVICAGSENVQVGFAGDDHPVSIFPCVVARPLEGVQTQPDYLQGELTNPLYSRLSFPIKAGLVNNWDEMEKIWYHCFYNVLRVAPEEHPVLLTRPPLIPKAHLEKIKQIMFETFNTPANKEIDSGTLSLYAYGRTTGVTVELGAQAGYVTPVYEGDVVPHAIMQVPVTGDHITQYLMKQLNIDRVSAVQIKESVCYVASDYDEELQVATQTKILEKHYSTLKGMLAVNMERFHCAELLFQGGESLAQIIHEAIMKCDEDIRRELWANIGLAGGGSLFPGLRARLEAEVTKRAPPNTKVRVLASPERRCQAWIGASILGSLSTFQHMWVSKQEYDESGPSIVHRKCFGGSSFDALPVLIHPPPPSHNNNIVLSPSSSDSFPTQLAESVLCAFEETDLRQEFKRALVEERSNVVDYTLLPHLLESATTADIGVELRPTIITVAERWFKNDTLLGSVEQKLEQQQCFDLLDILTNSGALLISDCSMHIVVASTHYFEKTLFQSLVRDNIDPICLLDSAHTFFASTVHQKSREELFCLK